jgi:hypothetical protein
MEAVGDRQLVARGHGGGDGLSGGVARETGEGEVADKWALRHSSGMWSTEFESDSKFKRFK